MLLPGIVLVALCGEFGLVRSVTSFGLPRLNVLFLRVVLSRCSGVFKLSVSINGVSDPLSDSITVALFCSDGNLINRPSAWFSRSVALFLVKTLPLGIIMVWFVPDIANCGLSEIFQIYFVGFFLEIEKDNY